MRNAAVVAVSYFLSETVEFIDADFENYYFHSLATTLVIIFLCGKFYTKELAIYAVLQLIQGGFCLAILGGMFYQVEPYMYDYPINFRLILIAYELAILFNGVINDRTIYSWLRIGRSFCFPRVQDSD